MKHTVRILLFVFCTLCSVEAASLRKAKWSTPTVPTAPTVSGSLSIPSVSLSLDSSSSFGSSGSLSLGSSYGHTQDICSRPAWASYCADVQKSKSGAFVRALHHFQRSHKGCRSKTHTHKKKKKGNKWLERTGKMLEWYNKHSLLEEGSTTEATANCHYHSIKTSDGSWGTFTVHFVTPTSLNIGQQYPVRGPWRINQANPSEKYREYSYTTGYTKPGRNYMKTFSFTGKYAQQEMDLNGVSSVGSKHVKDCGHYYCMESGAPIHN